MRGFDEKVAFAGQCRAEPLRGHPPQEKGARAIGGGGAKDFGGQRLPSKVLVALWLADGDAQNGVQQQDALPGPGRKVAVRSDGTNVGGKFGQNISQAVAWGLAGGKEKASPVARPGVG